MLGTAGELARGLARNAEAVCRYDLSNGRRVGRYWIVGDVHNTPGRSMFVRLIGGETGPLQPRRSEAKIACPKAAIRCALISCPRTFGETKARASTPKGEAAARLISKGEKAETAIGHWA